MMFRMLLPELHNHFGKFIKFYHVILDEEEVNFRYWAASWFENFLSKELPIECVLRLYDAYFAKGLRYIVLLIN